jgi:hypothetical protein
MPASAATFTRENNLVQQQKRLFIARTETSSRMPTGDLFESLELAAFEALELPALRQNVTNQASQTTWIVKYHL